MFDEIQPLHKEPDVYVDRLSIAEIKPIFIGPGAEITLRNWLRVISVVVKLTYTEIHDSPVCAHIWSMG